MAKSVLKESKSMYENMLYWKYLMIILTVSFCFFIIASLSNLGVLGGDVDIKYAIISVIIIIIMILSLLYYGIFIGPKL